METAQDALGDQQVIFQWGIEHDVQEFLHHGRSYVAESLVLRVSPAFRRVEAKAVG